MAEFHIPYNEPFLDLKTGLVTKRWRLFLQRLNQLLTGITFDDISGDLTLHATRHQSGGADAIKLDDLATPDDNTDLNASVARHGLLPKLSGNGAHTLKGDGTWS